MCNKLIYLLKVTSCLCLFACSNSSDSDFDVFECNSTTSDSSISGGNVTRIRSEASGVYKALPLPRQTNSGVAVDIDYMVHSSVGQPTKALLVLIAGGQLNANINPGTAAGNFLVRSAHLFAQQGFTVVTIDRPSDYTDFVTGNSGFEMDPYRVSMKHAVDLSAIINVENISNLPVLLVGTSRGAISAVANNSIAAAIALSSPVTASNNGRPIESNSLYQQVRPSNVQVPAHVLWHVRDGCSVSPANKAENLVSEIMVASGSAVKGGFNDPNAATPCKALTFHGFLGIETCAVQQSTAWMDSVVAALPTGIPTANSLTLTTKLNTQTQIDLSSSATGVAPLSFETPYSNTSLDGNLEIDALTTDGSLLNYTPKTGLMGVVDTFVYVVVDANGGRSHNVVSIQIN